MPKFVSGKSKRKPQDQLSVERYQYLGLDEAEPNLGDPLSAESLAESIPGGQQYQIVSVAGHPGVPGIPAHRQTVLSPHPRELRQGPGTPPAVL